MQARFHGGSRDVQSMGDFVARQLRDAARDAVAVDLRNTDIDPTDSEKIRAVTSSGEPMP